MSNSIIAEANELADEIMLELSDINIKDTYSGVNDEFVLSRVIARVKQLNLQHNSPKRLSMIFGVFRDEGVQIEGVIGTAIANAILRIAEENDINEKRATQTQYINIDDLIDEAVIESVRAIIEENDPSMLIKRYLYRSVTSADKIVSGEYRDWENRDFSKILCRYIRDDRNSEYAEKILDKKNKSKFVSEYISTWFKSESCRKKERESIITLALVTFMTPEELNQLLNVSRCESNLFAFDPNEATAIYSLRHNMGYNGFSKLLSELNNRLNQVTPSEIIDILMKSTRDGNRGATQVFEAHISRTDLTIERFLSEAIEQPLAYYSKLFVEALGENNEAIDLAWKDIINIKCPNFLSDLPNSRGASFYRHIKNYFPSYGIYRNTPLETYKNLYTANAEKAKRLLEGILWEDEDDYDDIISFTGLSLENLEQKSDENKVESIICDVYSVFAEAWDLNADSEDVKWETGSRTGEKSRNKTKLPKWCRHALSTPLFRTHSTSLFEGKKSVTTNDIVLMMLWCADLEARKYVKIIGGPLSDLQRKDLADGIVSKIDFDLGACGMGGLHPCNPFHVLAEISLRDSKLFPIERFANLVGAVLRTQ